MAEIGLEERETGEPVLVLQSGHGVSLEDWAGWVSQLADLAPVVAFDRPGTGRSPYDGAPVTPDRMVLHTRAVLDALEVSPPYILVGHSWGAELIGRYAAARPEDVSGLVFLDPTPRAAPEFWWGTDDPDEIAARHAESDSLLAERPPPGEEGLAAERAVMQHWVMDPPRDVHVVPDLAVPVAILLAAPPPPTDPPGDFTPEFLRAFNARKIQYFTEQLQGRSDATLIVATSIGHMVYIDDPQLALDAVRRVVVASTRVRRRDGSAP